MRRGQGGDRRLRLFSLSPCRLRRGETPASQKNKFLITKSSAKQKSSRRGWLTPVLSPHRAYRSVHGASNTSSLNRLIRRREFKESRACESFVCYASCHGSCVRRKPISSAAVGGHIWGQSRILCKLQNIVQIEQNLCKTGAAQAAAALFIK